MLFKIAQILAITLLSIALASPIKKDEVVINNNKGYEISLILDISGSMSENGKFDIVRDIVNDFLKKRVHDKVALSIFADFAYVAVPLTYDKKAVSKLLNRLEVGIAGRSRTALYEALFLSTNIFKNSKAKNKIAILLTDGMDNANTIPLDIAIKRARKYDVKVYTIGIGGRGDYNPYVLKEIAQKTGGKFFEANSVAKLKEVYETINRLEKSEIKTDKYVNKSYYFGYPLSLAILLLLVIFYIRNRR
jgi:Ca-activated chloride channel family protein